MAAWCSWRAGGQRCSKAVLYVLLSLAEKETLTGL